MYVLQYKCQEGTARREHKMAITINVKSGNILTKFGKLSTDKADFGYGMVWLEGDHITYQDMCGFKTWKTVRGFERWVDRQNTMSNGRYAAIAS